jgi:type I restriction enzyme, S subunit
MTMTPLRDFGTWSGGNTPSKANPAYWTGGTIPWISPKDMKVDEIESAEDQLSDLAIAHGKASVLEPGAVLVVTRSGILSHTLPVAITRVPVTINQDLKALAPRPGVLPRYVAYALRGAGRQILNVCSRDGTTVASVDTNALLDFRIPLASTEIQAAIVAEVEKQFSRLDDAIANIQRVRVNLKHYRASVIGAAIGGSLVEKERGTAKRFRGSVQSGEQRLQAILAARRSNWIGRYEAPAEPNPQTGIELPEGWTWASIGQLLRERIVNGLSIKESATPTPVKALRLSAMSDMGLKFGDFRFLPIEEERVSDILVSEGDFFVSRGNGSLELVGRGSVAASPPYPVIFPDTMMRLRFTNEPTVLPWIRTVWSSRLVRKQIEDRVKTTAGIFKISQPELASIAIPLPPVAEQVRIVAEVDRRLSIVREMQAEVEVNLKRSQALRQAILEKAFSS